MTPESYQSVTSGCNVGVLQAAVEDAARDPEKAARKVGNKAEEAGEQVGDIAEEGAEKVESAAGSARQWIEDWKKEQGTK